ncbi:GNAT family N-acetyltransferase [Bacillus wiedmannii]|uniref:GNAT family N-acetyltransferase n=1 Tax=Bacillus wiedmannii TaxID=1890302 RepID=UPI000BFD2F2C|nr:GNAT family N-acetyltransferase [Bacillus wiedmannii]PHD98802.1 hypothetical protein COF56_23885 [Bacillus wiedmannii]PHG66123.1 hypothetical protein COI55_18965 [Bacillus wiedmannii]
MYLRKRISKKDDCELISMTTKALNVSVKYVETIFQSSNEILVCCDNKDNIIGYICYRFITSELILVNFIVIKPKYQNKGIVKKSLPEFIERMINIDVRAIYGLVNEENKDALETFEKLGLCIIEKINEVFLIRLNLK